jgi:N-acetylglucosaminyl-diphospho-decaprenol L-rhamnosyltransferase
MIPSRLNRIPVIDIEKKGEPVISQSAEHANLPMSIVVVSYNSRELLRACLASIESEQSGQVTVIDNVSSDGSDEMVAQDFPWVKLIKNKKNDGYSGAANLAIASCSSKYVLLLNSDTLLRPGTLQALTGYLDQHPEVAIAGPSLVNPDGMHQASCFPFPTPLNILRRESSLSKIWSDNLSTGLPRFTQSVPWVLGAALAIRLHAFESVGGFDPSFFMYYEEVDLCYRLNKSGWQTHFVPEAIVTHIGGASTKQQRTAMAIHLYKSLCHFYRQHYSRRQRFQLKLVLTYLMLRNIVKEIFRIGRRMIRREVDEQSNDMLVWHSVLSSLWSTNGWLKP